ncbi:MAG TPA: hypothetical protein VJ771_08135 [Candidatus Nitrosotalea sp.]|nr:hypothetical protein [Candidatus Nitrosotalea sp.]
MNKSYSVLIFLIILTVGIVPVVYSAHAQESSPLQQATQNGVTMQFQYSPPSPTINDYTTLMFSVINSTTGKLIQNYAGSVTVGNVAGFTGGSGYYNFSKIAVTNGSFSVNYAFPNDGLFPIFFRADYPTSIYGPDSPIAIGEFKVIVPPPQVIPTDNTMIYVGIGIAAAVGGGVTVVIIMKRKPAM